jgi:putative transposase
LRSRGLEVTKLVIARSKRFSTGVEALAGSFDMKPSDKTSHHPPHILLNDSWYLVTARTHEKQPLLQSNADKEIIRDNLHSLAKEFTISKAAWVILDNHYHLLLHSEDGRLSTFIQRLHGRTAYEINKRQGKRGRQVWHNYWETLIRGEADYWVRFNYIHQNPVKHSYVAKMEDWEFSSYRDYVKQNGQEWMDDVFRTYPIIDFVRRDDLDVEPEQIGSKHPAKASSPKEKP